MKKFVISLLCMASFGILGAQTVYYVSPDGKDKNSGTFKSPFKTIEKARLQARQSLNDVTIYLREGIYRLEAPLIFTPEDGHAGKSLTIRPYQQERAVMTSGVLLTPDWKPYRNGIMQASIEKGLYMDMLCFNDQIGCQARYPNYDSTAIRCHLINPLI